jgi:Caudovirus prohead serine protease
LITPYSVSRDTNACSVPKPWAVKNSETGDLRGCHATKEGARRQQAALYANVPDAAASADVVDEETRRKSEAAAKAADGRRRSMERDDLYWVVTADDMDFRSAEDGGPPLMVGYFARFKEWTEINSLLEGRFMERFVPGAFKKTVEEQRDKLRVLFQHGRDPAVGDKPIGTIEDLREDENGVWYEVRLLDAPYVRDAILPGRRPACMAPASGSR